MADGTGTTTIPIVATDGSGNAKTNTYQIVVPTGPSRSFTWDDNGNLLSDGIRTYAWDAENRPIRITQGNTTYTFAYNAVGQRVSETRNGTLQKRWIWAGGAQPAEERDASNAVTKRFFPQGEIQGATKFYYSRDHLGSIREVTDSTAATVASYTYDAWGKRTLLAGTDLATFSFTGHYENKEIALIATLYRLYDPETGRWLSRDPIGELGVRRHFLTVDALDDCEKGREKGSLLSSLHILERNSRNSPLDALADLDLRPGLFQIDDHGRRHRDHDSRVLPVLEHGATRCAQAGLGGWPACQ